MTTFLAIPKGDGIGAIDLNMSIIYLAEQRSDEIAIVNQHRAPELISLFTRAYSVATENVSVISGQVVLAQNAVNKRKAVVMLDVVSEVLKAKGLFNARSPNGSEDQRSAVLELDEEYISLRDRMQQLEAYHELLRGKQKHLEMCYLAIRKIIGDSMSLRSNSMGSNFPTSREQTVSYEVEGNVSVTNVLDSKDNVPSQIQSNNLRNQFGKVG